MTDMTTTARLAGQMLMGAGSDLLLAGSENLPAAERLAYGARAWTAWATACAAMSELEGLMPKSVEAGYALHAKVRDFRERHPINGEVA